MSVVKPHVRHEFGKDIDNQAIVVDKELLTRSAAEQSSPFTRISATVLLHNQDTSKPKRLCCKWRG